MFKNTISAGLIFFIISCCSSAWATSVELNNWPNTYLIQADGSLALIDKGIETDGLKIGGDNLGIMFENVAVSLIKYHVLKIEVRVSDPLVLMGVVYKGEGYRKKYNYIHLYGDGKYHQYRLDFTAYPDNVKTIETLYLYFLNGDDGIDLRRVALNYPDSNVLNRLYIMWENFIRPRILGMSDINFITSPRIFNASFITILHIWAAASLFILLSWRLIWYRLRRKRTDVGIIASLLAILLSAWMIADIRNMYDEFYHVKLTWEGYLKPKEREGRFFDLRDYFGFIEFVKENTPEGVKAASIYAPQPGFIDLAKYHLYPTVISEREQEVFKIFYKYPFAEVRGEKLYYMDMDGENRSVKGRIIKRWNKNSFIFLKTQNG